MTKNISGGSRGVSTLPLLNRGRHKSKWPGLGCMAWGWLGSQWPDLDSPESPCPWGPPLPPFRPSRLSPALQSLWAGWIQPEQEDLPEFSTAISGPALHPALAQHPITRHRHISWHIWNCIGSILTTFIGPKAWQDLTLFKSLLSQDTP